MKRPEPLAAESYADVIPLLVDAGLPVDDLGPGAPVRFLVLREAGAVVASGALERYGEVALLRSIAVAATRRGEGLGRVIVEALEASARASGVVDLYLLTTTAAGFFAREGYEIVPREAAPEAIRATVQFSDLCPDSATFMHKALR